MSDNMTPRDRALAGEVVKLSDETLEEMRRDQALLVERFDDLHAPMVWLAAITELIAARKEIEELKAERAYLEARIAELKKENNRLSSDGVQLWNAFAKGGAERDGLKSRVAELEKERDHLRVVAREAHAQLQRAADGAAKLRRALNRITDIRPLGIDTYEECFRRMRAIALDAIGDDGPPGPKHPLRVPGHNPVG